MGNYFFLQVFTVIFALSIATTIFNKRILGFPQAIGVPIVSAIFVFILQWGASLLSGNQFITINIHNIEEAVRHIDFYDFLINGVICFILTSSALKFKVSDLRSYWKPISILASIALVLCAVFLGWCSTVISSSLGSMSIYWCFCCWVLHWVQRTRLGSKACSVRYVHHII